MVDTDWSAMLEAARMHRLLWSETADELKPGEAAALSRELHRITANYGLTYCDRLKLRIRIDGETRRIPRGLSRHLRRPCRQRRRYV